MAIVDLYLDYGIQTAPEGHKHNRPGWLNISCPHCSGTDGFHLGFNLDDAYFFCFRCGGHSIEDTISKLLQVHYQQAKIIVKDYRLSRKGGGVDVDTKVSSKHIKIGKKTFKYPSEVTDLMPPHRRYLEKRGFDPDYLIHRWNIRGTSPTSQLDKIPYKFRVLAPIVWEGVVVSFQTRDYTGKQERYMACPEEREIIHHKHILYGHQKLWPKRRGILVEGIFDVWRLDYFACGVLGVGYTPQQVRLLGTMFDELIILFDPEPVAQKVAVTLQKELIFRGVKTDVYSNLPSDPGSLSEDDATHLLKELKFV